ncbi:hypothetical protein PtA15_5A153 [Puccinia triticina]|uniref:Uncharacterized protein n=1 Tax=Puccinia triticina TaxID=208348 RepID=A0ABY7CP93_9BASI|nr:uncharacterized protein PtA15_5A153 [Puccinia triticina]WAQ84582.1 hypothetical protein PtA15_5A153 [Puccinia triticina]
MRRAQALHTILFSSFLSVLATQSIMNTYGLLLTVLIQQAVPSLVDPLLKFRGTEGECAPEIITDHAKAQIEVSRHEPKIITWTDILSTSSNEKDSQKTIYDWVEIDEDMVNAEALMTSWKDVSGL